MSTTAAPGLDTAEGPPRVPAGALSVTELHRVVDEALHGAGLGVHLWVTGTITGYKAGPRFSAFELVDYGPDGSSVAAVLAVGVFAAHAKEIRSTLAKAGAELADGLQVALWGRLDPNPRYGRMRLLAERIDARTTVGAVVLARDDLVAELERAGRLRAQAARVVPDVPRRIGLVSAATAAGRADVIAALERSDMVAFEVVEAQVPMSGPNAPAEVARAVAGLAGAGVDVILIARGGGAKSDLATWESRAVAMAITSCPVAVWTALGHSTDHTLADSLAHTCHATPTAAATALVARGEAVLRAAEDQARRRRHEEELAVSRARARRAVLIAVVVALVAIAVLAASRL